MGDARDGKADLDREALVRALVKFIREQEKQEERKRRLRERTDRR